MNQNSKIQMMQGYTIIGRLGNGRTSICYEAKNDQGIRFALNKMRIFGIALQDQQQKCLKTKQDFKKLKHPHIIRYIDSFVYKDNFFFVNQWAEQGNLKDLIDSKKSQNQVFQECTIWEFMKQMSSALQYLHLRKIIHPNLSAKKVLIAKDRTLKVGDLGFIGCFGLETLQALPKIGLLECLPPPEVLQNQKHTQAADIWLLGCICYELAQLKSPFQHKKGLGWAIDIIKGQYQPICSKYSPQLKQIISNMLDVNPKNRCSAQKVFNYATQYLQKSMLQDFGSEEVY